MKIDVKQIKSEKSNNFEIYYNDKIHYRATLPFLSVKGFFDLDKIQEIKVFELNVIYLIFTFFYTIQFYLNIHTLLLCFYYQY